jgi:hypothetical protein
MAWREQLLISTYVAAALLAGCADQPAETRQSSFAKQFASLNKDGWTVTGDEIPSKNKLDDPSVHVVKEAQFNLKFDTNFQIADPKIRAQYEKEHAEAAARAGAPTAPPANGAPAVNFAPAGGLVPEAPGK